MLKALQDLQWESVSQLRKSDSKTPMYLGSWASSSLARILVGTSANQAAGLLICQNGLIFPLSQSAYINTPFDTAGLAVILFFFFQNWIHLEVQINHIRSYFQHRALGTGQRDSKLSKTKLWKNKNTPKMSLLKGSLPFGFKMLSVTTLGNLSSTEINIIRKGLSMGGKTRKQKEMWKKRLQKT